MDAALLVLGGLIFAFAVAPAPLAWLGVVSIVVGIIRSQEYA